MRRSYLSEDAFAAPPLTHALALVVLVDEDVVQDEVEQLVLQGAVGVEDQRLEPLPAAGDQLVAEDHQQVAEEHEGLRVKGQRSRGVKPPVGGSEGRGRYLLLDRRVDVGQALLAHGQEGLDHPPQGQEVVLLNTDIPSPR